MLKWAVIFLIIAILTAAYLVAGRAGMASEAAR